MDHQLDGVPIQDILEGFARLHDLVLVTDSRGRLIWLSDGLAEICGGRDRLLGESWTSLAHQHPDSEHTDLARRRLCERGSLSGLSMQLRQGNGDPLGVDVSAFLLTPGGDGASATVMILRRSSEREQADVDSAARLELLSGILDASADAVIGFDRAHFVTFVNPAAARLLGERPEMLKGKPIALFLPHANGVGKIVSALQPQEEITGREIELRRADGENAWLSISTRPLRDADGNSAGGVAFLHDVTRRRTALDMLERQNAELESYVHSVSHDLRSPLVSLLGFTRLLRQDYQATFDDTGNHFLDRIEQAGRTMEALIHDLLELTKIGLPGEQRTLVDPRAVLMQLHAELKPRLDDQGIELDLPQSPPLLLCDRTRIYQVFSNLIGNAVNHMGPTRSPQIQVRVTDEPDWHHITVSDNGKGIPRSEQERIFEVFQTVAPRSDGRRSTGIGLAIVKKIAHTHNGRVWVESEPDQGAAFHIQLPR